jgi:hypothetical protein
MATVLSVTSSLLVGAILIVAPWTALWETNVLLEAHPALRALLLSAGMRGAVSGLGAVNVLLAVYEALEALSARGGRG